MAGQKEFDFNRASKLNTLECVMCAAGIKGLLKALDGFARDAESCTETLRRIALSMGVSPSTARRAVKLAVGEGLLTVSGDSTDGCANTYTIRWGAVFDLPTGAAPKRRAKGSVPPPKLEGDPCQVGRGPLSSWKGTPAKLVGVSRTDLNDPNDVRPLAQPVAAKGRSVVGEEDSGRRKPDWIDVIDRELPPAEMMRVFELAAAAGLFERSKLNCLRVFAVCRKAKTRPSDMRTGFVIRKVQSADWTCYEPLHVRDAVACLQFDFKTSFSAEEVKQLMPVKKLAVRNN